MWVQSGQQAIKISNAKRRVDQGLQSGRVESSSKLIVVRYLHFKTEISERCLSSAAMVQFTTIEAFSINFLGAEGKRRNHADTRRLPEIVKGSRENNLW